MQDQTAIQETSDMGTLVFVLLTGQEIITDFFYAKVPHPDGTEVDELFWLMPAVVRANQAGAGLAPFLMMDSLLSGVGEPTPMQIYNNQLLGMYSVSPGLFTLYQDFKSRLKAQKSGIEIAKGNLPKFDPNKLKI